LLVVWSVPGTSSPGNKTGSITLTMHLNSVLRFSMYGALHLPPLYCHQGILLGFKDSLIFVLPFAITSGSCVPARWY